MKKSLIRWKLKRRKLSEGRIEPNHRPLSKAFLQQLSNRRHKRVSMLRMRQIILQSHRHAILSWYLPLWLAQTLTLPTTMMPLGFSLERGYPKNQQLKKHLFLKVTLQFLRKTFKKIFFLRSRTKRFCAQTLLLKTIWWVGQFKSLTGLSQRNKVHLLANPIPQRCSKGLSSQINPACLKPLLLPSLYLTRAICL